MGQGGGDGGEEEGDGGREEEEEGSVGARALGTPRLPTKKLICVPAHAARSEECRVGKERRARWLAY